MEKRKLQWTAYAVFVMLVYFTVSGCATKKISGETPPDMTAPALSEESHSPSKKDDQKKEKDQIITNETGTYRLIKTPFGVIKKRLEKADDGAPMEERKEKPAEGPAEETRPKKEDTENEEKFSIIKKTKEKSVTEKRTTYLTSAAQLEEKRAQAADTAQDKEKTFTFNFDGADLYEVIRTFGEILNINYMVEPTLAGKVSIHTTRGINRTDVFSVFYQILEANGLTAVKEDSLYRIVTMEESARQNIALYETGEGDIPPRRQMVIQIIPLEYISVQEMTKLLQPFISKTGTIISHEGTNVMVVVDRGINIMKCLQLADAFDVDIFGRMTYRFYALNYIAAKEAAEIFEQIFSSYKKELVSDTSFIAIERLNLVLVMSADNRVFTKIDEVIHTIDVAGEGVDARIYVYAVKNGAAADLEALLNNVFGKGPSEDKTAVPKKDEKSNEDTPKGIAGNPLAQKKPAPAEKITARTMETEGSGTLKGEVKITADETRNLLIIEATPPDYHVIERILNEVDVLPRQALIDVTLAEITLGEDTELGIEWEYRRSSWVGEGLNSLTAGATGLQYAIGLSNNLQAKVSALAEEKKVNILSSPHILASDNKTARIDISTEIPVATTEYNVTSSNDDVLETSIEYRDTGVILSVTPHISESGMVTMDVEQEVSEQSANVSVGGNSYPSFYKRSIATTLSVKHGQTLVIGGIISETGSESASGVPCLIKIPIVRYLFGKEKTGTGKTELIVMITPRVIVNLQDVEAVTKEFQEKVHNVRDSLKSR